MNETAYRVIVCILGLMVALLSINCLGFMYAFRQQKKLRDSERQLHLEQNTNLFRKNIDLAEENSTLRSQVVSMKAAVSSAVDILGAQL